MCGFWEDGVRATSWLLLFMIDPMCVGRILPVVGMISIYVSEAVYWPHSIHCKRPAKEVAERRIPPGLTQQKARHAYGDQERKY
jgi:hypothetical protein